MEELTLEELGRRRAMLREELKSITERIQVKALAELAEGKSESDVSRRGQVDRMTMRKWQGKR
jgi:hypothetical protein